MRHRNGGWVWIGVGELAVADSTIPTTIPKGASEMVRRAAEALIRQHGPGILRETCKVHFKTTDDVLGATGFTRADLG